MNQKVKDYLILFGVAGAIIALDQWTKWLVRENIEIGSQWLPEWQGWLHPYARIVHWYNSGAAFGMFQNGNLVFTVLAILVIIAIVYYFPQVEAEDWTLKVAMGLQLAGAAGNLIDLANSRGGHDNITVVLMRVPEGINTGPLRWLGWNKG